MIFSIGVKGQTLFSGSIKDKIDKTPLTFVHVFSKTFNKGTMTDEKGDFMLKLPKFISEDTICLQILGYEPLQVVITLLDSQSLDLEMIRVAYELPEAIVSGSDNSKKNNIINYDLRRRKIRLGCKKRRGKGNFFLTHGSEIAVLCEFNNDKEAVIQNLKFFIQKKGNPLTSFRIHLYNINPLTGAPNKDILNQSIIVKAQKGGKWLTVDLSNYSIKVPKGGFFASMEWLPEAKIKSHSKDVTGQVLGGTNERKNANSITWSRKFLGNWDYHQKQPNQANTMNAMIVATVKKIKNGKRK
jgi:hypothetical protein